MKIVLLNRIFLKIRCRAGPNCRAFIINYSKHSCVGIGYDSETSGISMVATDERM